MAAESPVDGEPSSRDLKLKDLNEFSNIFSSEFNKSGIHDRVLCFQIIEDDELNKIIDHNNACESERATESKNPCVVTSESENKNDEKGSLKDGMLVYYNLISVLRSQTTMHVRIYVFFCLSQLFRVLFQFCLFPVLCIHTQTNY